MLEALVRQRSPWAQVQPAVPAGNLKTRTTQEGPMARREVHTLKTTKGWANKLPGGKVLSNHRTKATAEKSGRTQAKARKAEHVIHKVDGTIGEKNSYGNDPRRSKG